MLRLKSAVGVVVRCMAAAAGSSGTAKGGGVRSDDVGRLDGDAREARQECGNSKPQGRKSEAMYVRPKRFVRMSLRSTQGQLGRRGSQRQPLARFDDGLDPFHESMAWPRVQSSKRGGGRMISRENSTRALGQTGHAESTLSHDPVHAIPRASPRTLPEAAAGNRDWA